jgi:hypothetical protein
MLSFATVIRVKTQRFLSRFTGTGLACEAWEGSSPVDSGPVGTQADQAVITNTTGNGLQDLD